MSIHFRNEDFILMSFCFVVICLFGGRCFSLGKVDK